MNWTVYAIFAYLFTALQLGLSPAIAVAGRFGPVMPRLDLILVTFVGLFAAPRTTMAAWVLMGLLIDVAAPPYAGGVTLIGPNALGYLAGAFAVLQLRGMVLRTHPISLAFCTVAAGLAVHLVVVLIFTIRSWYDPAWSGYAAVGDLTVRALGLLYTAAFSLLLAWPLLKLIPAFGLQLSRHASRH